MGFLATFFGTDFAERVAAFLGFGPQLQNLRPGACYCVANEKPYPRHATDPGSAYARNSAARLAANSANAKKCTDKKNREGKFKASLNSLKHGLYSHTFIIKTEDSTVFENFSKSIIDEFLEGFPRISLELVVQVVEACEELRLARI